MLQILTCVVGMALLLAVAVACSADWRRINWRTVAGGLGLQLVLGAFVLYVPAGQAALQMVTNGVGNVLGYVQAGIDFVFGGAGSGQLGFVFAFQVLPAIIFMSSLISVLYHLRIMPWVVRVIGGSLSRALNTTAPESLVAATNIFIGHSEAPIAVRPFLPTMSRSELFAVMVGGMATVAGATMAGYVAIGVELKYLIAASFMAAPGGLAMAKIFIPEDPARQATRSLADVPADLDEQPVNVIDAAAQGASTGLLLAANVGAMLIAFVALIALANGILGWGGSLVGFPGLSLELILGYLFAPVAWLIGVPWSEAIIAGGFIGQKLVLNEFVAYVGLMEVADSLSAHTQAVVTIALCGFANLSSIAILLGGIGGMAPNRRDEIAELGLRALAAASLANLMSAAMAAFFLLLAMGN